MASIFKIPRSPFWFAAYRGAQGERVQRTTKQSNRTAAMRIAQELERLAEKGRSKTLTEALARKAVAEIIEYSTGESLSFHTCRAWLDEWLAGKRGSVAAKSIEKYEQVTRDFLAHLGTRADLPLASIAPKDVRAFRDELAKGDRSPGTVNQVIGKVLSAPFHAALRLGYVPMNPCAAVEMLKAGSRKGREVFTPEQVAALVRAAQGDWKGAILIGYFTGLRLRDVTGLTWESVDPDAGTLTLTVRKTGAEIVIPLHPEVADWLAAQTRGIGKAPLFPTLANVKSTGGRHGLSGQFNSVMEAAGIRGRTIRAAREGSAGRTTSSLSFHSLRHSFVSSLANAGVSAELRQKLSGHADDRSHAKYTHHELETLRDAVGLMPRLSIPAKKRGAK